MKRKYVILSDRMGLRETLINLGDRVLTEGFCSLVRDQMDGEVVSAGWKMFPYINSKSLSGEVQPDDIIEVFDRYVHYVLKFSAGRISFEKTIRELLNSKYVLKSSLGNAFEGKFKTKFSRGLFETLMPYLLKADYANRFIKSVKTADVAIYNGAGLLSDHLKHYMVSGLFECYLAKKLNKKVVTVNQTVDVTHPLATNAIKVIYLQLDMHVMREPLSADRLISLGIPAEKVIVSCDSAFAAPYDSQQNVEAIAVAEGISKGDICLIIRGDRAQNIVLWSKAIERIRAHYNKNVWVMSTCLIQDNNVVCDLKGKCEFYTLSKMYDYPETKELMRYFDVVVTDRYHAAIFSILSHTPIVPISPQTIKMDGLFRSFDYPVKPIACLSEDNYEEFIKNFDLIYNSKDALRQRLKDIALMLVEKVKHDYKQLREVIE
ncbi:polysaccharide pyruvyl transferase family protein [Candidatus Omnitrophota bacterium]